MQKPDFCSFRSRVHRRKGKGSGFSRQRHTRLTPEQTDQPLALLVLKDITVHVFLTLVLLWKPFDFSNRKQHFSVLSADIHYFQQNYFDLQNIFTAFPPILFFFFFFTNEKCSARLDFFKLFCSRRYSTTHFVSVGHWVPGEWGIEHRCQRQIILSRQGDEHVPQSQASDNISARSRHQGLVEPRTPDCLSETLPLRYTGAPNLFK